MKLATMESLGAVCVCCSFGSCIAGHALFGGALFVVGAALTLYAEYG